MKHARTLFALTASTTLIAIAALALAGPLDPPSGPITSTHKTLTEIEPRIAINSTNTPGDADSLFKITQPGSYYLTANITGVVGKRGIEITASGVTLDLNGFHLIGVAGSLQGVQGIAPPPPPISFPPLEIVIRNGQVRGWGNHGIDVIGDVIDVTSKSNAGTGIVATTIINCRSLGNSGDGIVGTTVKGSQSSSNTQSGIVCGAGGFVIECEARANLQDGISGGDNCQLTHSVAVGNNSAGIRLGLGAVITACTASANAATGIVAQSGSIAGCLASNNPVTGIELLGSGTVTSCTALGNGTGISALSFLESFTIVDCTSNSNTNIGINCSGGIVRGCTSASNDAEGVKMSGGGSVIDCSVSNNGSPSPSVPNISISGGAVRGCQVFAGVDGTAAGILCTGHSVIEGNTITSGTSGWNVYSIEVTGSGNTIVGNSFLGRNRGIRVVGTRNIVMRNIGKGNTDGAGSLDWNIAAGNSVAPIVIAPTNAVATSGSSYAGTLGTTDPNANFTY